VGLVELRQHFNRGLVEIIRPFFFTLIWRLN
jgi:hypothetical protein